MDAGHRLATKIKQNFPRAVHEFDFTSIMDSVRKTASAAWIDKLEQKRETKIGSRASPKTRRSTYLLPHSTLPHFRAKAGCKLTHGSERVGVLE